MTTAVGILLTAWAIGFGAGWKLRQIMRAFYAS